MGFFGGWGSCGFFFIIFLGYWMSVFGHYPPQKTADLYYVETDRALFSSQAQFLLLQLPSQVWNSSPTWYNPMSCNFKSRLPLSLQYLPTSLPQSNLNFFSWLYDCLMSLGLLFVLVARQDNTKNQETSLEWSKFPQCLGHFLILLNKRSPEEIFSVFYSFFSITATWLLPGHLPTLCKGDWSLFPS